MIVNKDKLKVTFRIDELRLSGETSSNNIVLPTGRVQFDVTFFVSGSYVAQKHFIINADETNIQKSFPQLKKLINRVKNELQQIEELKLYKKTLKEETIDKANSALQS